MGAAAKQTMVDVEQSNRTISGEEANDIISGFERVSEKAGLVQTQTLRRILDLNCGAEYLKKWLGDIRIQEVGDSELDSLYSSLVPLSTHVDYEPFIQRTADGDTSPLLTQQPVTSLALSKQYTTKGGLRVASATTAYFNSPEFKLRHERTKLVSCSPLEVIISGDYKQATYCHLLLGLFFSDQVEFIDSCFAYSIVEAFAAFEGLWKELCGDIRDGTLSTRVNCPKLRKADLDIICPNPSLALKVEENCEELEKLDWYGLIPKLWPNAKYIFCITTGSMQTYVKKLRHYATDLPLVGDNYASSEGFIGANIDPCAPPEQVSYTVVPTVSYYEFIPLYKQKQINCISTSDDFIEGEPIPLSQVKVGQEYEIVVTTFTGLYRSKLGDVVEVVGFHNGTPKLKFIWRRKLLLCVTVDKTTEEDLQMVVERGSEVLVISKAKAKLIDFTSHAKAENQPGHYVTYWEIKGEVEEKVLQECCTEMDASFTNVAYVAHRKCNSIGPLELRIVEGGSFKKILDHFIGNGGTFGQFKTPRCTNNNDILRILNASTTKVFTAQRMKSSYFKALRVEMICVYHVLDLKQIFKIYETISVQHITKEKSLIIFGDSIDHRCRNLGQRD